MTDPWIVALCVSMVFVMLSGANKKWVRLWFLVGAACVLMGAYRFTFPTVYVAGGVEASFSLLDWAAPAIVIGLAIYMALGVLTRTHGGQ